MDQVSSSGLRIEEILRDHTAGSEKNISQFLKVATGSEATSMGRRMFDFFGEEMNKFVLVGFELWPWER